jgi:hypothetical protein
MGDGKYFLELIKTRLETKNRLVTLALVGNTVGFASAIAIIRDDSSKYVDVAGTVLNFFAWGMIFAGLALVAIYAVGDTAVEQLMKHQANKKIDERTQTLLQGRAVNNILNTLTFLPLVVFSVAVAYLHGYASSFFSYFASACK